MRMFQTGRFLTLNVSNTDLANLYVLSLAALGGGLVGAGVSQLKPADLNIFNLLKPPKPSGKVLKISIRCELQMKDKGENNSAFIKNYFKTCSIVHATFQVWAAAGTGPTPALCAPSTPKEISTERGGATASAIGGHSRLHKEPRRREL